MKVFHKKVRDRSTIPCEGNCPYLVVTDTLNCRKDSEGVVDMEEVRGTGKCPFWPQQEREITRKGNQMNRGGIEPVINKAD
jgi:hypothetical protein